MPVLTPVTMSTHVEVRIYPSYSINIHPYGENFISFAGVGRAGNGRVRLVFGGGLPCSWRMIDGCRSLSVRITEPFQVNHGSLSRYG